MINTDQESYKALRETYSQRTQGLIAWVGSGLSQPAGMPSWAGLRNQLHKSGIETAHSLSAADQVQRLAALKKIENIPDNWVAFRKLKDEIGDVQYTTAIRRSLAKSTEIECPQAYLALWRLNLGGVLSLNIDAFARRAFHEVNCNGKHLHEFSGRQIDDHFAALKSPGAFLANLHGSFDERTSWVFAHDELRSLLDSDAYQVFITSVLTTRTVLFLGIGVEDVATSMFLKRLTTITSNWGPAYWLTDKNSSEVQHWADKHGILPIFYGNEMSDHREVVEFLEDLQKHVPEDDKEPPIVIPEIDTAVSVPSPAVLATKSPEEIRLTLNARAAEILQSSRSSKYKEYDEFCSEYELPIHTSWHVSLTPPHNVLFGYTVTDVVGKGAFGKVFKARAEDGKIIAIKRLQQDVQTNYKMLASFSTWCSSDENSFWP